MHRLLVACALLTAAGCVGEDVPDYRPLELDYMTSAIFAPSCATANCHSSYRQPLGYVFDSPEATRKSLIDGALIRYDSAKYDQENPANADLIIWITQIDPFGAKDASGNYIGRMPLDAPLPNRDVKLLVEWIQHSSPGAQCNPDSSNPPGNACARDGSGRDVVVKCTADWNFDMSTAIPCANGCVNGVCTP